LELVFKINKKVLRATFAQGADILGVLTLKQVGSHQNSGYNFGD